MSNLTPLEKRMLEDLFNMSGGYVLDYTNESFALLFQDVLNVDIYTNRYSFIGDSKAKRLRAFWQLESDQNVAKVLDQMLKLWKYNNDNSSNELYCECIQIVNRLLGKPVKQRVTEDTFLDKDFTNISIKKLQVNASLEPILEGRLIEAEKSLQVGSHLAVIFLTGSILEGLLLDIAIKNTKVFFQSSISPKDKQGKVLPIHKWSLNSLINVAYDLNLLKLDVKKFSHSLRDFRNYIHPYEQMNSEFDPDEHTAKISLQVLKAAIADLSNER